MHDVLFQKLGQHIGPLFERVRREAEAAGEKFARTPYTDELFSIQHEAMFPHLEQAECRALAHRIGFRETAPPWAPAELPLSSADCEKMIHSRDGKIAVVGFFGRSLACALWSNFHLLFRDYVSGLLACEHAPPCIRTDPALLKEFQPKPFRGFDKSLCWGTHFRIVEFTQQLMKAEEIWLAHGLTEDAKWMSGVIEQLTKKEFFDSQPPW